jgi:hypothetical protein
MSPGVELLVIGAKVTSPTFFTAVSLFYTRIANFDSSARAGYAGINRVSILRFLASTVTCSAHFCQIGQISRPTE